MAGQAETFDILPGVPVSRPLPDAPSTSWKSGSVQPEGARVVAAPVLVNVMRAMVLSWEPLIGVVATDEGRWALRPEKDHRGFAGWLTYLARTRGEVPPLPPPVRTEPVEDKGTLIVLAPDRLSASNPEHLALGRGVQEVLDSKGLLRPVLSWKPRDSR